MPCPLCQPEVLRQLKPRNNAKQQPITGSLWKPSDLDRPFCTRPLDGGWKAQDGRRQQQQQQQQEAEVITKQIVQHYWLEFMVDERSPLCKSRGTTCTAQEAQASGTKANSMIMRQRANGFMLQK